METSEYLYSKEGKMTQEFIVPSLIHFCSFSSLIHDLFQKVNYWEPPHWLMASLCKQLHQARPAHSICVGRRLKLMDQMDGNWSSISISMTLRPPYWMSEWHLKHQVVEFQIGCQCFYHLLITWKATQSLLLFFLFCVGLWGEELKPSWRWQTDRIHPGLVANSSLR